MSNEFCPSGHELNADGTCSRDGYVKPAETVAETPENTEVTETPEESGNVQVEEGTPESPSTGSSETSGLSTDIPPTEPVETSTPTDGNAPPDNTCVGCEG